MFAHTHSKLFADQVEPTISFKRNTSSHNGTILFKTVLEVLFINIYK